MPSGSLRFSSILLILPLLFILGGVLLYFPGHWFDIDPGYKFGIIALSSISAFMWLISKEMIAKSIESKGPLIAFFIFCVYSLLSSIWTDNVTAAFWDSAIWLQCFVVMYLGAWLGDSWVRHSYFKNIMLGLFVVLTLTILISHYLIPDSLNSLYLGVHKNYLVQYLLFLSLFSLSFCKDLKQFSYNILICFICLWVGFVCRAKGAMMLAILIALVFNFGFLRNHMSQRWPNLMKQVRRPLILTSSVIATLIIVMVNIYIFRDKVNLSNLRLVMAEKSLLAFMDHYILGAGAGNYYAAVYDYGLDDFKKLRDVLMPSFYGAHTKLLKILVELGLVGISLFFIFLLQCGKLLIAKKTDWTTRVFIALAFYLLSSSLYESSYSFLYHNSNIQFLIFLFLGTCMTTGNKTSWSSSINLIVVLIAVLIAIYMCLSYHTYHKTLYRPSFDTLTNEEKVDHFVDNNRFAQKFHLYVPRLNYRTARFMRNKDVSLAHNLFLKEYEQHRYDVRKLFWIVIFMQDEGYYKEADMIIEQMNKVHKSYYPLDYLKIRRDVFKTGKAQLQMMESFKKRDRSLEAYFNKRIERAPGMRSQYERRLDKLEEIRQFVLSDGLLQLD